MLLEAAAFRPCAALRCALQAVAVVTSTSTRQPARLAHQLHTTSPSILQLSIATSSFLLRAFTCIVPFSSLFLSTRTQTRRTASSLRDIETSPQTNDDWRLKRTLGPLYPQPPRGPSSPKRLRPVPHAIAKRNTAQSPDCYHIVPTGDALRPFFAHSTRSPCASSLMVD